MRLAKPSPVVLIMLSIISGTIYEDDDMGIRRLDITTFYRCIDQQTEWIPVSMDVGKHDSCIFD